MVLLDKINVHGSISFLAYIFFSPYTNVSTFVCLLILPRPQLSQLFIHPDSRVREIEASYTPSPSRNPSFPISFRQVQSILLSAMALAPCTPHGFYSTARRSPSQLHTATTSFLRFFPTTTSKLVSLVPLSNLSSFRSSSPQECITAPYTPYGIYSFALSSPPTPIHSVPLSPLSFTLLPPTHQDDDDDDVGLLVYHTVSRALAYTFLRRSLGRIFSYVSPKFSTYSAESRAEYSILHFILADGTETHCVLDSTCSSFVCLCVET